MTRVGTTLLRAQTNPPYAFIAWAGRCRFRYMPFNQENCSVVWVRLHQFQAPLALPPVVTAHLEYSAAATAKQFHFLPLLHVGSVTKSNSDKCWGGAAGVGASNSLTASLQPLLKFTPGTPMSDVAPEGETAFEHLFPGAFHPPLLESLKIKFSSEAHRIIHQGGKLALQPCSNQK